MSPEQRQVAFGLTLVPGREPKVRPEEFADLAAVPDPGDWALDELRGAIRRQDPDDAEAAFLVGSVFGQDDRWVPMLTELLDSEWHELHESAASALGDLGSAEAVPALVRATHRVPEYLDYDEGRALAVKAIHSLGKIPGDTAAAALHDLLRHEDHALRPRVQRVLHRRTAAGRK